jgi:hypothetical protein
MTTRTNRKTTRSHKTARGLTTLNDVLGNEGRRFSQQGPRLSMMVAPF